MNNTKHFTLEYFVLIWVVVWLGSCISTSYHSAPVASYQTVELSGFKKKWKLENVFIGYTRLNSMMVASRGTVIFIGGLDINDNKVIALDASNGELLWQSEFAPGVISISSDVFVGGQGRATVKKLELETGMTLWETKLPNRSVVHIIAENNKVNVQTSGHSDEFFILDANTGEIIMQTENSKGPIHLYSEQVRFQQGIPLNRLESIYNNTNEIIWQTEMSYDFSMPPLFWETKILVATERGGVYCISRKTGDIIWHIENIAISNLAISNNSVYFFADDEKLMEVDLQSGEVRGFVQFGVDDFVTNENTFIGSYYVAYDAQTKTVFVQFGDSAQLFALQVLGK